MATPPTKLNRNGLARVTGKGLILLVKFYRAAISPYLGSSCRHTPTCSLYMIEAIEEWGPLKGTWLGLKRVGRCHPWGTTGYDPVPKKEAKDTAGKEEPPAEQNKNEH